MATFRERLSRSSSEQSSFDEDNASIISDDSAFCETTEGKDSLELNAILKEIAELVGEIKDNQNEPTKVCKQLGTIRNLFFDKPQYRKEIGEALYIKGYTCYSYNIVRALKKHDFFHTGVRALTNRDLRTTSRRVMDIAWNYSNYSEYFSEGLAEYDVIKELGDYLARNSPEEIMKNRDKEHLTMVSISIMRNVAANPNTIKHFHAMDAYSKIKRYCKIGKKIIKLITYTTMAMVATKEQAEEITCQSDIFEYIVRLMTYAAGRDDLDRIDERYTAADLALYLTKMSIDGNIKEMMKTNILDTFYKMLKSSNKVERSRTALCLFHISLSVDGREAIKNHADLSDFLKHLEIYEEYKPVKDNIKGALSELFPKGDPPKQALSKTRHIFINYNQKDKDMVMKIVERIKLAGFNIWIDYEKADEDFIGAIASAVENSSVIVVCVSEPLRQDPRCRKVANQAFKRKKDFIPLCMQYKYKPDGWLELITDRKYIDFSGQEANFETSISEFLELLRRPEFSREAVQHVLNANSDGDKGVCCYDPEAALFAEELVEREPTPVPIEEVTPEKSDSIPVHLEKMDSVKVRKWITNTSFSTIVEKMNNVDGKGLWELHCMKIHKREMYNNVLQTEYGLTEREFLDFSSRLRDLVAEGVSV